MQAQLLSEHSRLALSSWTPHSRANPPDLDQMSENIFRDTEVKGGEVMVVLSSEENTEFHSVRVEAEAILVIVQLPLELLQQFATKLGVIFTPSEYGVYKKVFRPSQRKQFISNPLRIHNNLTLGIFTIIRNQLWSLCGTIRILGYVYGRSLDQYDLASGKWRAASADTVRRLERKSGHMSDDDCVICMQSLTVTKSNCPHYFHTSCIEEWLLEKDDSCPVCRAKVGSEWASTDAIGETADGEVGGEGLVDETDPDTAAR